MNRHADNDHADNDDDDDNDDADIIGGWIIVRSVLTPSRTKISRCTAYFHDKSVYQKSGWYLKALKSYPFFKMNPHANADNNADNDDDVDTTGGRIIVCAEFLIPSQTKNTGQTDGQTDGRTDTTSYRDA